MLRPIQAERLKMKRTFAMKLVWLAPLLTLFFSFALMHGRYFQSGAYNWWYVLMLPGALSLFCALLIQKDARMKFRPVLSLPVSPSRIWLGKAGLGLVWLAAACLLLFAGATLGGQVWNPTVSLADGLLGSLLLVVTMAWQIPLCLFLAARLGLFVSVLANLLVGLASGLLAATHAYWWAVPYAIPLRLMAAVLGIAPNGLPLEAGDPLWDKGVILPGLVISLALAVLLLALTSLWFRKKEAR